MIYIKVKLRDDEIVEEAKKRGIDVPEDYDMGPLADEMEQLIWDAFQSATNWDPEGKLLEVMRKDIEENYSVRTYRVEVERMAVVLQRVYVEVEARDEYEANDKARDALRGETNEPWNETHEEGEVELDSEEVQSFTQDWTITETRVDE